MTGNGGTDRLVWVDCEMTGLDPAKDALIEVAALVTDAELNVLGDGDGVDVVIHADEAALAGMPEVVREMHAASGLTEAVRASTVTTAQAQDKIMAYITEHIPQPRTAPLCGNSIATDRGFLARDMPVLDGHLHYRMIDVSSVKELCRRWYPRVYFSQPAKGWPTARSPTSGRASGSSSTTGGRYLSRSRGQMSTRPKGSRRSCRHQVSLVGASYR